MLPPFLFAVRIWVISIVFQTIAFKQQGDKLVFVALNMILSLRTSAHAGVAIPRIFRSAKTGPVLL